MLQALTRPGFPQPGGDCRAPSTAVRFLLSSALLPKETPEAPGGPHCMGTGCYISSGSCYRKLHQHQNRFDLDPWRQAVTSLFGKTTAFPMATVPILGAGFGNHVGSQSSSPPAAAKGVNTEPHLPRWLCPFVLPDPGTCSSQACASPSATCHGRQRLASLGAAPLTLGVSSCSESWRLRNSGNKAVGHSLSTGEGQGLVTQEHRRPEGSPISVVIKTGPLRWQF